MENRPSDIGTWQLVEDPKKGAPMPFNSKTGATQPAPAGVAKTGTYAKTIAPAQDAINYAQTYSSGKNYTGPGDEAVMEKFFELAKPSTGFRMSQPQIDMLKNAQSWKDSVAPRSVMPLSAPGSLILSVSRSSTP